MLEKDNEASKSDGGAGGRTALPEDEKAGSLQGCTQAWGSLAGHVVPGPLVMRKCEALGDDMGKRNRRGHPWKTTNEFSLSFPLCTPESHPDREVIRLFERTAISFLPCECFLVLIYLTTYFAFLWSVATIS